MYSSKLQSGEIDRLFRAVLSLETQEECYRFFEDICTIGELHSIAQRWEVAELLYQGTTYNAIADKTKASSATISRVNKCLNYGADGYRLVLERLTGKGNT
jgi:TrpR-related protein YerC/YecD